MKLNISKLVSGALKKVEENQQPKAPEFVSTAIDPQLKSQMDYEDLVDREAEAYTKQPVNGAANFTIPASPEVPIEEIVEELNKPNPDTEPMLDENCAHICEECNEWWSHGPRNKCRHPDIIKQGLCSKCLTGAGKESNPDPIDGLVEDDHGKLTLSGPAQVKARNEAREMCKNMDIEQLSLHIRYIYKKELELRAHGAEVRKMRADLIEFEAQNVPEVEREAFRQAMLTGQKRKERKAPAKKTKDQKLSELIAQLKSSGCANAELVAKWMTQTGKSREQVEALLND